MGKRDRDQKQDLYKVLNKAWTKWVPSYPKPPPKKKLSEISTADDHDSEYDVSDRLMEEETWDDETMEGIEVFSSFFYDDAEKGKESAAGYTHAGIHVQLLQMSRWRYLMFGILMERIEDDWLQPLSGTAMREPWKN